MSNFIFYKKVLKEVLKPLFYRLLWVIIITGIISIIVVDLISSVSEGEGKIGKFITDLIQISIAVLILWYTIETRKYRIQAQKQTELLSKQIKINFLAYLIPKLTFSNEKASYYTLTVDNPTEKIAIQLNIYLFDIRTKKYASAQEIDFLNSTDTKHITLDRISIDEKEMIDEINEKYGSSIDILYLIYKFRTSNKSFIALLYRDIQNNVIFLKREFTVLGDHNIIHEGTILY